MGGGYYYLHDYAKAEEYYLKALENDTQLFSQYPDAYRASLAMTQWNLMLLYGNMENWEKYDEMLDQALKNYKELALHNTRYQEDVEVLNHRKKRREGEKEELANKQYDSAVSYYNNHDYAKAEEYYLKALENYTQLFTQNPDAYRTDLAITQNNLGALYYYIHHYAKAEEYYLKALENKTRLFNQNPDAYRADLADTQDNLGYLYRNLHDYAKAEEYYLQALENRAQLFSQNPDAYRAILTGSYNQLAYLYAHQNNFTKALETIDKAIELMPEEADYYDSKGEILLMKGDEQEALKLWQKVLELDPDFLQTHDSDLYKQLKEKGLITE